MPKKYQNRALLTKPNSSAPSHFSSSKAVSSVNDGSTGERSVNDLIRESRLAQNNEQYQIDTSPSSSLPPSLRAVLNMPVPPPPAPRNHLRGPTRLRRIPGPPPPRSWLSESMHAPKNETSVFSEDEWSNTRIQHQFSLLPGGNLPSLNSLQHLLLKKMSSNWAWHTEYDHTYMSTLPVQIREALLSYIAIYDEAHWPRPLPYLFPNDCDQDELEQVNRLDLTNCIGSWATVKKIERELLKPKTSIIEQAYPHHTVPDKWDSEANSSELITTPLNSLRSPVRFTNLKHLSLAVNPSSQGKAASWSDLLSLASHLSTITSLSLANWPQPTYTPYASKGIFKVSNSRSNTTPTSTYGGSNFYTAFDSDWREAAGILRTLSRSFYCLKWLDLSGCGEWFPALTWQKPEEDDVLSTALCGPDWNGGWRNVELIILAVGWSPGPLRQTRAESFTRPTTDTRESTSNSIQTVPNQPPSRRFSGRIEAIQPPDSWDIELERKRYYRKKEVALYKKIRQHARQVAQELRKVRTSHGGRWIEFDFGNDTEGEVDIESSLE